MKEVFKFKKDYLFKANIVSASMSFVHNEYSADLLDINFKTVDCEYVDFKELRKILENREAEVIIRKKKHNEKRGI